MAMKIVARPTPSSNVRIASSPGWIIGRLVFEVPVERTTGAIASFGKAVARVRQLTLPVGKAILERSAGGVGRTPVGALLFCVAVGNATFVATRASALKVHGVLLAFGVIRRLLALVVPIVVSGVVDIHQGRITRVGTLAVAIRLSVFKRDACRPTGAFGCTGPHRRPESVEEFVAIGATSDAIKRNVAVKGVLSSTHVKDKENENCPKGSTRHDQEPYVRACNEWGHTNSPK